MAGWPGTRDDAFDEEEEECGGDEPGPEWKSLFERGAAGDVVAGDSRARRGRCIERTQQRFAFRKRHGDEVDGLKVVAITQTGVRVESGGQARELRMK